MSLLAALNMGILFWFGAVLIIGFTLMIIEFLQNLFKLIFHPIRSIKNGWHSCKESQKPVKPELTLTEEQRKREELDFYGYMPKDWYQID